MWRDVCVCVSVCRREEGLDGVYSSNNSLCRRSKSTAIPKALISHSKGEGKSGMLCQCSIVSKLPASCHTHTIHRCVISHILISWWCDTNSYCVCSSKGLGYHEDLRTRTSFIEVLTTILKEGAQFSSLAETALADRLNQMLDLVTTETPDGDLPLVMALIDSVPPENVVSTPWSSVGRMLCI